MHRLIQQAVRNARIVSQPRRQPPIPRRPRKAPFPFEQQPRGYPRLTPIRVHQAIQFIAEIQRFHAACSATYTLSVRFSQWQNQSTREDCIRLRSRYSHNSNENIR